MVSAIEKYPLGMTFFSTPERIEIGGIPLVTSSEKPTRRDGLIYYRRVAEHYHLDVRVREAVTAIRREPDGTFLVSVRRPHDEVTYHAKAVVIATGYYDQPNALGVPGEDLPHVSHYFVEGHRHWRQKVVIVGGGNSAVDAALESWRAGAEVTMVLRGDSLHPTVKAWVPAGHHQSPHRRQHKGPLPLPRPRHHADARHHRQRSWRHRGDPG